MGYSYFAYKVLFVFPFELTKIDLLLTYRSLNTCVVICLIIFFLFLKKWIALTMQKPTTNTFRVQK